MGKEKHNWYCVPHWGPSTASNKHMETILVSWVSFDFAVSCNTSQGISQCWPLHWCYLSSSLSTFVFIICVPSCCFFLTGSGSESCFARPLSNNPSSAVLGMEGCSLNLFSQKAHHKTCLISSYLVCSLQTESIYRPRLLLTLLSALDYSSLPPLSKIKC